MTALRTLLTRPSAAVALAVLVIVALVVAFGELIAPHDPLAQNTADVLAGPSAAHWLGTDYLGRDILSRLLSGTRLSVLAAAEAVLVALLLGTTAALTAVFGPRPIRWVVERVVDSFMALPFITFAVAIGALLGNSIHAAMVAVGVLAAPTFVRVVRAAVLRTAQSQYVEAARLFGVPVVRIVLTHVLPRIVPVLLVTSASALAASLLVVASLTFLGVGVQPPAPTWGGMLSADLSYLALRPFNPVAPALAIMVTVAALGILADRIRDLPQTRIDEDGESADETTRDTAASGDDATESVAADDAHVPADAGPIPEQEVASGSEPAAASAAGSAGASDDLLTIDGLRITAESGRPLVRGVDLRVPRGASVGILGESGSGKTLTVKALLGALPDGVEVTGGSIDFAGERIGSVFQDPATWFAPHLTLGSQIDEVLRHAQGLTRAEAAERRRELLTHVGLDDPDRISAQYVHELSGGMIQRILLAIAVSGEPDLLVADEATTALDVTVQAEVLGLIRRLRAEHALSVLMISHDLAVLAHSCEYLYVFRDGVIVEAGPTDQVLRAPQHPYTRELVADHTVFGIEAVRRAAEEAAEEEAEAQTGVRQP